MGWKHIARYTNEGGTSWTGNGSWVYGFRTVSGKKDVYADLLNTNGKEFIGVNQGLSPWELNKTYRLKLLIKSTSNSLTYSITSQSRTPSNNSQEYTESVPIFYGSDFSTYTWQYDLERYVDDPSTPSSIAVPQPIRIGDKFTVSWGASSSPEGGSITYQLQRSINSGSYTTVYTGTSRSFQDTALETWNTVSYRVRASDPWGYSSYRTSSTVTIIKFPEFNMKINGVLKTSENGWVKVDGQLREIESIKVKINGVLKEV